MGAVRLNTEGVSLAAGAAVAAASLLFAPSIALAQQAADAPLADNGNVEIVVTGTKQHEELLRAPVSALVITADALERSGVSDFEDLPLLAPSLTIAKTTQPANNSINIRGIGTYAFSIATEPSVAVVIDDVPQAFQASAFTALFDVQQIEVLRGPQSTLFGKSASAGVVAITTPAVSRTLAGSFGVEATNDGEERVQGALSGPLTNSLGFRLAANYSTYRGTLYNLTTGHWLNGQTDLNVRGKLEWRPNADLTLTLSPFASHTDATCCAAAETFVPTGAATGGTATGPGRIPTSQFLAGITPGGDNRRLRMDVDARGDARDAGAGLKIEQRLGELTLTSITSYDQYHLVDRQDTDSTDVNFAQFQPVSPVGGSANGGYFDIYSTTQELRLNSSEAGPARFVAGLFFSDTRSRRYFVRGSNALDDYSIATPPGFPGTPAQPASLPTTNSTAYARYLTHARATNYAIFGQAELALTARLDLLLGARVNREIISYAFADEGNGVVFGDPHCSSTTPSGIAIETCNQDTATTGRLGLRYQATPGLMVYAAYARGYKGMAYDLSSTLTSRGAAPASSRFPGKPLADAVAANQPIPAETVDSYELGIRSAFFDRRVTLNLTAFDMVFAHFQAQSRDLLLAQNLLNSIGRVTSQGVEAEAGAHFGGLNLNLAATYDRAIMNVFPNAACYFGQTSAQGCVGGVQDLSGRVLPAAPTWNLSANLDYETAINAQVSGFVTLGYHWQSRVIYNLLQDPASVQSGYGLVDLSIGVRTDHWRASAFVNNLFDQRYMMTGGRDAYINNPPGQFATSWKPGRDAARFVGARLSYAF